LRTAPNPKIILHWILTLSVITLIVYNIELNRVLFSVFIGILLLSLIMNRTHFIRVDERAIKILKNNFLFVRTYNTEILLQNIDKVEIKDNGFTLPVIRGIGLSGNLWIDFIFTFGTGVIWYGSRYSVLIHKGNSIEEYYLNFHSLDVSTLKRTIEKANVKVYLL